VCPSCRGSGPRRSVWTNRCSTRATQRRPQRNGYLAASLDVDGFTQVGAWTSTVPQGPWQRAGVVATNTPQSSGQLAYDGRMANLPGAGWTVVYGVNDPVNNTQNVDLYGGRFATPAISIP